ncbi:Fe-S cluster assembly protein SufD [Aureimonas sp. Leaf454]|uniref:Fe-S cluster assembly protein SufD n=1 Tax=Aureimonas sp. Leaf454 TaxID=1736381 RepID=UPI0006F1C723|nr:Fe-S cluster assembly protein SufD [Aureimonas sp. Leaf454]KQT48802.1 Fe-S cluster assembly protein SufD [Aureimonas sp. Leaf454]
MSVHQLRRLTPAEEAVIASAETGLVAGDDTRREAIALLRREGLPHRRIEAWHYTDFRSLIGRVPANDGSAAAVSEVLAPLLPGSTVVDLAAGAPLPAAPAGVSLQRSNATPDWRKPVNHLDREFDTVRLIGAAFGATATEISVDAGADVDHAIELRPEPGSTGARGFARCTIGAGAKATIVERLSAGHAGTLSCGISDLVIGDGAEVLWIVDQAKGEAETYLGQLNVSIGADGRFRLFVLNAGGALVRMEVHAETAGEGADIQMRGVNLLSAGQHIDVTTTLNHTVANTTSTETFRNVVTGGHGVFQGMIKVSKGAQKTDARMACNTLLLSDEGDFSAKPELEIFADDVQCGHGATAGEIDSNHLFYLMSRGIPEREARALLVKAFVAEVVEELEHEAAIEALEARIDAWLDRDR